MFKPHVTVANVVQAENHFLIVEETIHGNPRWNQPAGHLEADETVVQAARRELWEEAGIDAEPQHLLRIHQWLAPDKTPFMRFLFAIDLPQRITAIPQDDDIDRCLWLKADEILSSRQLRSPLVAESILAYRAGVHYPLDIVSAFQWPFPL
ncbi:NUDIX domain-containing protein [Martelella alba]|uniref:NUDIX hydrolase n=1 Tax=Martelella alba TaxID=2590451 RepID=A0ABY2SPX2_9HYPH|nr:NUDIX hydrolase [Martelella alba]TKI07727.1 NUDIX hydrolase [Martelella alba]